MSIKVTTEQSNLEELAQQIEKQNKSDPVFAPFFGQRQHISHLDRIKTCGVCGQPAYEYQHKHSTGLIYIWRHGSNKASFIHSRIKK